MQVEAGSNGALTREQFHERERAAFMSGEEVEAPAEAEADAPAEEAAEPEQEAVAEDESAEEDAPAEEAEEPEEQEAKPDAESGKRLEQVRKTEARMREQIKRDRDAFVSERDAFVAEWKPKIEAAERFERMRESARNPYTIAELLLEAGMAEDDFEAAAQALYAHSTKGKADPKNREYVARSKRERDLADQLASVQKRLDAQETKERQAAEEAKARAEGERIIRGIVKTVKPDASPLLVAALAKNTERTHQRLAQIAGELFDREGVMPDAAEVHAEYERVRREELTELGIDPATVKPAKVNGAKRTVVTTAGTRPATNGNGKPNGTADAPPSKADIIRELEELERNKQLSS